MAVDVASSIQMCVCVWGGGGGIFAIMAYTGKHRSIGVGISHQLSITYELSSPEKGGRGGLIRGFMVYMYSYSQRCE